MSSVTFNIDVEGAQKTPFETELNDKWLAKPLLKALLVPLLEALRRDEPKLAGKYQVKMLSSVTWNGKELDLNSKTDGVNAPCSKLIDNHGAGGGDGIQLVVVCAEPEAGRTSFLKRLSSGLTSPSGGGGSAPKVAPGAKGFVLTAPELTLASEISKKWLKEPVRKALIEPFLLSYNLADGVHISYRVEDLQGFNIVQEGKDPIPVDADRALDAPVEMFVYGDVTTFQLIFKGSEAAKQMATKQTIANAPTLEGLMAGMKLQPPVAPGGDDLGHEAEPDGPIFTPR